MIHALFALYVGIVSLSIVVLLTFTTKLIWTGIKNICEWHILDNISEHAKTVIFYVQALIVISFLGEIVLRLFNLLFRPGGL